MAWAEGQANLIAIRYLFRGMNLGNTVLDHGLDPGHVLDGRLLPAALERASGVERRLLDFVYLEGFARTVELFREGGWTAVERATQAHRTTSAVMHGGAEARSPVRFGPPETPAIPDLRLVDEDSLGEQGIVVLISLLTGKDNLGLMTGDGWTGDRLYRWETEDGSAGLTDWRTRWTDAEAASDFAYGFLRALRARFPESPPKVAEDGRQFVESGGRTFLVDLRGAEVRIRVAPTEWNATLESDVDASSDPALDAPRTVVYNSPPPPSSSRRERMEP
jgi:hypothetical protein